MPLTGKMELRKVKHVSEFTAHCLWLHRVWLQAKLHPNAILNINLNRVLELVPRKLVVALLRFQLWFQCRFQQKHGSHWEGSQGAGLLRTDLLRGTLRTEMPGKWYAILELILNRTEADKTQCLKTF